MDGKFADISDVQLLGGIFKDSQDTGEKYLLSLDIDRLLAPCFESAGLTPKKERYSGWEAMQIGGHSLGHYMSALSVMYQASGNGELKRILEYAADELYSIQSTTGVGYIGGLSEQPFKKVFSGDIRAGKFDLNGFWVPWYSIHKIYQGLIDAYRYAGIGKALDVVTAFADWAADGLSGLSEEQIQSMLNCEHGGMNEVFAELYGITGKKEYLFAAEKFTHNEILEPLESCEDHLTGLHANTQIPKIIGAAAIYEQDGKYEKYKTAAKFFWNAVTHNRSYVFGGNSVAEHFEALGAESLHIKTAESCNTHNMLKLTEKLFSWEHEKGYMDFFENALYNHILGTQDPCSGNKTYFTSTLPGHYRIYSKPDSAFWCCTGTGMENPGRYARGIYFIDGSDLYVNLFIASKLNWREKGIFITQENNFPFDSSTRLIVSGCADANIKIRIPSWCSGEPDVLVNGEKISACDGGYISINRSWADGDGIEVSFPRRLSKYTASDNENKVAFTYGPVVLAGRFGKDGFPEDTVVSETKLDTTVHSVPSLKGGEDVESWIKLKDEKNLIFEIEPEHTSTGEAVTLAPFFGIHHEFYNVYWYLNASADAFETELNNITIDCVEPDGQQDEIGHELRGENMYAGSFVDSANKLRKWRAAAGDNAYFSYKMALRRGVKNYICLAYWGSDSGFEENGEAFKIDFDIITGGVFAARRTFAGGKKDGIRYAFYELPYIDAEEAELEFRVKLPDASTGRIFEVRTTERFLENAD